MNNKEVENDWLDDGERPSGQVKYTRISTQDESYFVLKKYQSCQLKMFDYIGGIEYVIIWTRILLHVVHNRRNRFKSGVYPTLKIV